MGAGLDKSDTGHLGDEHHAHQIAAGSVLILWEEKQAHERSKAEERRRKSSLGSDADAQQVRHPWRMILFPLKSPFRQSILLKVLINVSH